VSHLFGDDPADPAALPPNDDAFTSDDALTSDDLDRLNGDVPLPNDWARANDRERLATLARPVGALGRLEELSTWLAGV
jgi:nicotinate-nucleotide--dimethylbenzimidazole phosphoribosyltransferase